MDNASPEGLTNRDPDPIARQAEAAERQPADSARYDAAARTLYQQGRKGSNWFYLVAGLSLVNSIVLHTSGNVFFVVGLGVTLIADSLASNMADHHPDIASVARTVAFGFDVLVSLVVVGFGWFASKRYTTVFALGMGLYLLDGLLFVWLHDWMSAGFHGFALICMWSGFNAYRRLNALETALHVGPPDEPHQLTVPG